MERANIALDQARVARQKVAFFDPAAYGDPSGNLSLMSEMLKAIVANDLVLHHQPKYDIRKAKVTGVEEFQRLVAIKCMLPSLVADQQFTTMFVMWTIAHIVYYIMAGTAVILLGRRLIQATFAGFKEARRERAT